jgi:hypothetical protein
MEGRWKGEEDWGSGFGWSQRSKDEQIPQSSWPAPEYRYPGNHVTFLWSFIFISLYLNPNMVACFDRRLFVVLVNL